MLHPFIGEDRDSVREAVYHPFRNYLRTSLGLIRNLVRNLDLPYDMDQLLDVAFERYFETSALFGTVEARLVFIEGLKKIGIDEIGCLIDFEHQDPPLERGVRPGDLVGILLPRSVAIVAGLLAIHKVGAAYVPLDPHYPVARTLQTI